MVRAEAPDTQIVVLTMQEEPAFAREALASGAIGYVLKLSLIHICPSVCAIAFRVQDAAKAYQRALSLGAWGFDNQAGPGELNIPAIKGIGDSLIYLVDRWRGKNDAKEGELGNIGFYDVDFEPLPGAELNPAGNGLTYIDHLTHNVHRGRMDEWAGFYERYFNFREVLSLIHI